MAALRHPQESKNKVLIVNSYTTTPQEVLDEYEKQLGTKFEVKHTPLDELKKIEQEAWETIGLGATGIILRRIWTEGGTLYEKRDNELIVMEDRVNALQDAVAQAIKVQTT